MKLSQVTFQELDKYHSEIPMLKSGSTRIEFTSQTTYLTKNIKPFNIDMTFGEKTSLWKRILEESSTKVLVIEEDNIWVAGAIIVTHSPLCNMLRNDMSNAVLWDIRVNPSYQKRGYASLLMKEIIAYATEQKCSRVLIETQDNNPKAIPLYLKNGATLLETNKSAYSKELNEWQYIFQIKL